MSNLVSIIVPVYKVENYLNKCIESLVSQTYRNLEIILVDDGSPDSCPEICDNWAKNDSRIKVIHKPNGGLSDARNAGMRVATGDFIAFIDSDDYISSEFIAQLYDAMLRENSDIVECEVVRFNEGEIPKLNNAELAVKTFTTEKAISNLMLENDFHQHVWNKLYKSDIALFVPFEVGKLNEDEFWTYQVFGNAKKVTKINLPMYFYLQRASSIMGTSYNIKRLDALEAKSLRQKYMEEKFPSLANQAKVDLFASCIFAYQCVMKFMSGEDKKKAKHIIKDYVKKYKLSKEELCMMNGNTRIWFAFANINFFMCCKVRNLLGVGF